jgi:hypothetical protein
MLVFLGRRFPALTPLPDLGLLPLLLVVIAYCPFLFLTLTNLGRFKWRRPAYWRPRPVGPDRV